MIKLQKDLTDYLLPLVILFPLLLITGPFLPDLVVVLFSFFFLVKYLNFEFNKKSRFFLLSILLFYLLINISSLLSDHILISLKSSFFYFRFIFFAFIIAILVPKLEKDEEVLNILITFQTILLFF